MNTKLDDLLHENMQLKIQNKQLRDKIDKILETAYDLRSNLNSAAGYAKLLLEEPNAEPELQSEALGKILRHQAESVRLLDLTQDALRSSNLDLVSES